MATRKKQEDQKTGEPNRQAARFWVEPGKKVEITIEVGETVVDGKLPLTIQIEPAPEEIVPAVQTMQPGPPLDHVPALPPRRLAATFSELKSSLQRYDLAKWLFLLALTLYLGTRLVGLTRFPLYFFTDEAIQSQSMQDLMDNDYRDSNGVLLPTYFRNGEYYNLSLSVYLQWLPVVLFGKSAVATRATSVLVTLIAAISVGIVLRDIFKLKHWWAGTLFLSITPAWFLHSRTAFETAEFVSLYAGALCAYLFYRYKSPRFLYLAIVLGALAFYAYSPAQLIMPLTVLGLLLSDWRYHWQNRRVVLLGLGLGAVLALPYLRYNLSNPNIPVAHLHTLSSYWFAKIPLAEKIRRYIAEFGIGLSPWYWYIPNNRDLSRHLMKGYGNIMIATLPFAVLGLAQALRRAHQPSYRAVLIALLVSPAAAALVQMSITRGLVFVVPAAILTALGLEQVLEWVEDPKERLASLAEGQGPTFPRVALAALILVAGFGAAFLSKQTVDSLVILALAVLLAGQVSGVLERLAQSRMQAGEPTLLKRWHVPPTFLALAAFVVLAGSNMSMLNDALRNGPLWFTDYGMGGMQYGAFQIFDIIDAYTREHPGTQITFSPDWANGADVVARFFLKDPESIRIGSIRGHITQQLPLDNTMLFIMTPQEYRIVTESDKFSDIQVEQTVPYPDGNPGFYFVRLRYSDKAAAEFAAEKATREKLQASVVTIDGQPVKLRFTYLDSDHQAESMALVFDNDPFTVAKTFERNPFVIEMTFPEPRTLSGFSIIIGSARVEISLKCYPTPTAQPVEYNFEGQGTKIQPQLSFVLPDPTQVQVLQVEVRDPASPEQAKVHIWELKLR